MVNQLRDPLFCEQRGNISLSCLLEGHFDERGECGMEKQKSLNTPKTRELVVSLSSAEPQEDYAVPLAIGIVTVTMLVTASLIWIPTFF
jgi:hypothetical protein